MFCWLNEPPSRLVTCWSVRSWLYFNWQVYTSSKTLPHFLFYCEPLQKRWSDLTSTISNIPRFIQTIGKLIPSFNTRQFYNRYNFSYTRVFLKKYLNCQFLFGVCDFVFFFVYQVDVFLVVLESVWNICDVVI